MTPSHQLIEISIRANAWEGIGKELKIKRKFYVSPRDVRVVCPRLKGAWCKDCEVIRWRKDDPNH
jgi:hypothetical protein